MSTEQMIKKSAKSQPG